MFNEKNSELMKFVIKQAKTIDAKTDAPFTAERFLILLIRKTMQSSITARRWSLVLPFWRSTG